MKLRYVLLPLLLIALLSPAAFSADNWYELSASEAYDSSLGKEKLNPDIKLYMKGQSHPSVAKSLGEFKSNKRSNAFGKAKEAACQSAFLSAIIALQERAVREGGNAVVDIYSITKDQKYESKEKYKCVSGAMVSNVALMGTVAKLK